MFRKLPACGVFPLPKLRMELLRQPNIHTPRTHDGNPTSNSIESLAVFTSVTSQFFNESVSYGYLVIVCFLQNLLWPCEEPAAFATTWWHSCKTHWAQTNTPFLFAGFWEESRDMMNIETLGSWGLWRTMNFDGNWILLRCWNLRLLFFEFLSNPKAFLFCVGWNWLDPWWSICAWWLPYQMYREFFTLSKSGHVMAMWNTRGSPSGQNCSLYWSQEIL